MGSWLSEDSPVSSSIVYSSPSMSSPSLLKSILGAKEAIQKLCSVGWIEVHLQPGAESILNRARDCGEVVQMGERAEKRLREGVPSAMGPSSVQKLKSALKSGSAAKSTCEGQESDKKDVRHITFKDTTKVSEEELVAAMGKISSHIGNLSKFTKASKLALQLLESDSITTSNADHFFNILISAASILPSLCDDKTKMDCRALFVAAGDRKEVFSFSQCRQLEVWLIRADVRNELNTDDTFEFSRAASRLRQLVEDLPVAAEEEDGDPATRQRDSPAQGCVPVPVRDEEFGMEDCNKLKNQVSSGVVHGNLESADNDEDPFGLSGLLTVKKSKKEERAKRKREDAERARQASLEAARLLQERREAICDCLSFACTQYKYSWAQVLIDITIKHAHDHLDRFILPQCELIKKLFTSVKEQQQKRRLGRAGGGKGDDTTSFERVAMKWASEKVSIRGAVGASGDHGAETWLG
ncbi:hypothetical protein CBR_g8309 [Chara braunii]|uniref:Uncharacterized protein n=1 Tax=Chara braunii TaxID=69332 RepID=A0A388KLU1_CHABU|nr:hypothetical protein CBR_g8309 [Chara braunii]|eukprot:GBG71011.1 hypothetical protein CBR_g8309 [Chara braunii]